MASWKHGVSVAVAPGGFLPESFRWQGRSYRVLAVESVKTRGWERRFRVASREGPFELALDTAGETWRIRSRPNWLSRAWYRFQNGARYPLPAWQRRRARQIGVRCAGSRAESQPTEAVLPKARTSPI